MEPNRAPLALVVGMLLALPGLLPARAAGVAKPAQVAPVVVATMDSGTNPFHPCFRRSVRKQEGLRRRIPSLPPLTDLPLTLGSTYEESLAASEAALDSISSDTLYWIPRTNLSFVGFGGAPESQLVDDDPHGAMASSQIACERYGMGSNAHLVVTNWVDSGSSEEILQWIATQDWIDVVHLNIAHIAPVVLEEGGLQELIDSGKFVIVAGGNGVNGTAGYPSELDSWPGPPGVLVAGANDNGGYLTYSNMNPHVVMDGGGTEAAQHDGFAYRSFSGTSSSSPRITGYVTQLLGRLRAMFGHTWQGLITIPPDRARPTTGPLADGVLSAAELHEVIRKTANPNPHDSRWDGGIAYTSNIPQNGERDSAFYPKMGYGEISEHTIDLAIAVLAGRVPIPDRPDEDAEFERSESLRDLLWGS